MTASLSLEADPISRLAKIKIQLPGIELPGIAALVRVIQNVNQKFH